jgi:hypothetical protein
LTAKAQPLLATLSAFALALPVLSWAQAGAVVAAQGPAAQSAARVSYLDGSVSVLPPGANQWDKAFTDRPLGTGDRLWSDADSRAEVDLGGVLLRLSSHSEISMLDLSAQGLQLGIGVGAIDIALHYADSGRSFEIDTPEVALTLQSDGDYRINVDLDGATTVLVRSGATHLTNRSGEGITLRDGQGAAFAVDGTFDVADAHSVDAFDRWCSQRDAQWQRLQQVAQGSNAPAPEAAQDLPGAQQLNDAGQWSNQPDYGNVWFPAQVAAGWAPFHNGHWAHVAPWGWMWMERASWGFAPFHYGHWVNFSGRWGWVPPPSHTPPTFAPAQIAAPASITASLSTIARAARVDAPPESILHRPVVATRNPVSPAAIALPHVVVDAPAPRALNTYVAMPSPVGPTIYARDVRPVEPASAADNTISREDAVRAPLVASPGRSAATPATSSASRNSVSRQTHVAAAAPTAAPPPSQPMHRIAPPPPPPQSHMAPPRSAPPGGPARIGARASN